MCPAAGRLVAAGRVAGRLLTGPVAPFYRPHKAGVAAAYGGVYVDDLDDFEDDFEADSDDGCGAAGARAAAHDDNEASAGAVARAPFVPRGVRPSVSGPGGRGRSGDALEVDAVFEGVLGGGASQGDSYDSAELHIELERALGVLSATLGVTESALAQLMTDAQRRARRRLADAPRMARAATASAKGAASTARRARGERRRVGLRVGRAFEAARAARTATEAAAALRRGLAQARSELGLDEAALIAALSPAQRALRSRITHAALGERKAAVASAAAGRAKAATNTRRAKARKAIEHAFRLAAALPTGTAAAARAAELERALRALPSSLGQSRAEVAEAIPPHLQQLRAELRSTGRAERVDTARQALNRAERETHGGTARARQAAMDAVLAKLPERLGMGAPALAALLETDEGLLPSVATAQAHRAGACTDPEALVAYEVEVVTSDFAGAGTQAAVAMELVGRAGATTGATALPAASGAFDRAAVASFVVEAPDVGELASVLLSVESAGGRWHCAELAVVVPTSCERVRFFCDRWVTYGEPPRELAVGMPSRTRPYDVVMYTADAEGAQLAPGEGDSLWLELLYGQALVAGRRFGITTMLPSSAGGRAALSRGSRCVFEVEDETVGDAPMGVRIGIASTRAGAEAQATCARYKPLLVELIDRETRGQVAFRCEGWLETSGGERTSQATFGRPYVAPGRRLVKVVVHVSAHSGAGGDSNLFIQIDGESTSSGKARLEFPAGSSGTYFAGRTHTFVLEVADWGATFRQLRLSSDCTGFEPDLHLKAVEVSDLCPSANVLEADAVFVCDAWLSERRGDCLAERIVHPSSDAHTALAVLRDEDSQAQLGVHGGGGGDGGGAGGAEVVHSTVRPLERGAVDMMAVRKALQAALDEHNPADGTVRRLGAVEAAFARQAAAWGLTAAEMERCADSAQLGELRQLRELSPLVARLERVDAAVPTEERTIVSRCFRAGERAEPGARREEVFQGALKEARKALGVNAATLRSFMTLTEKTLAQRWAGDADDERKARIVGAQRVRDRRGIAPRLHKPRSTRV